MAIKFNYLIKGFRIRNSARIKYWLTKVIKNEEFILGDLNFIFVDDEYITKVNRKFLEHDWPTDVIAFDYGKNKTIKGEIYVGVETVFLNAVKYDEKKKHEIHRVMIHGLLHLMGNKDKTVKEERNMKLAENKYLELIENDEF